MNHAESIRLSADIGGTFTDVVLEVGNSSFTQKVLTDRIAPEKGVLDAIAAVIGKAGIDIADIELIIHGTTLATNAIIERRGAETALLTTKGFRDTLEMRTENRFEQYDISIDFPPPLVPRRRRFDIEERMDSRGNVLIPLDERAVHDVCADLMRQSIEAVAVCFLHSYVNREHEERAGEILTRSLPGVPVCLSSEVSPEMREYERTSTTVANAYVQPIMARYLRTLDDELRALGYHGPLLIMLSGGGVTSVDTAARFPIRMVESGPAGGAIFAAHVASQCGYEEVISFDMGGTTAKICLIDDGRPQTARRFEVARTYRFKRGSGLPVRIPVIEMVEIGAGGGSIAGIDALRTIAVGPQSAGANPGPACYGRGGSRPTVTDADLVLGRIPAEGFSGGRISLDRDAAERALAAHIGDPLELPVTIAALGISEMVDENMTNAARVHAIESGKDAGTRTLIAFGGAAPLHAARVCEKLGISRYVVPVSAGVGSAVGFLKAPVAYELVRSGYQRLESFDAAAVNALLDEMSQEARSVVAPAVRDGVLSEQRHVFMRYTGQGHELAIELTDGPLADSDGIRLKEMFEEQYRQLFSWTVPVADVELLSWRVVVGAIGAETPRSTVPAEEYAAQASDFREVYSVGTGRLVRVPFHQRSALTPGTVIPGPAVIAEDETTTIVSSAFSARIDGNGFIVCTRNDAAQ